MGFYVKLNKEILKPVRYTSAYITSEPKNQSYRLYSVRFLFHVSLLKKGKSYRCTPYQYKTYCSVHLQCISVSLYLR